MITPNQQAARPAAKQIELLDELVGTTCRCGAAKKTRQTFCRRCWYRLPLPLRGRLYSRFGSGYEEAYAEAVELLDRPAAVSDQRSA
ncbi:MAG: hypothetical protein KDA41_18610 [Planctomycetales bacterium]|nr:hypothetical protein [Planctomycetales bacterium]